MAASPPPYRVIICGDSLFLMAVEASLIAWAGLVVIQLSPQLPTLVEQIAALEPDIVLVERSDEGRASALTLSLLQQGWPLLELDATRGRAQILMGHEIAVSETRTLIHLIGQLSLLKRANFMPNLIQDVL